MLSTLLTSLVLVSGLAGGLARLDREDFLSGIMHHHIGDSVEIKNSKKLVDLWLHEDIHGILDLLDVNVKLINYCSQLESVILPYCGTFIGKDGVLDSMHKFLDVMILDGISNLQFHQGLVKGDVVVTGLGMLESKLMPGMPISRPGAVHLIWGDNGLLLNMEMLNSRGDEVHLMRLIQDEGLKKILNAVQVRDWNLLMSLTSEKCEGIVRGSEIVPWVNKVYGGKSSIMDLMNDIEGLVDIIGPTVWNDLLLIKSEVPGTYLVLGKWILRNPIGGVKVNHLVQLLVNKILIDKDGLLLGWEIFVDNTELLLALKKAGKLALM